MTAAVARALFVLCVVAVAALAPAHSAVIVNGGFESGFAGWTRVDQVGSDGTFHLQSGTSSPVNGIPVPAPPQGNAAAMTDAQGPGSHVMYQDFMATGSSSLSFELYLDNTVGLFFTPTTLDFSTPELNQQARVDILLASADPFSMNAADILLTLYSTQEGDAPTSGYTAVTTDLSSLFAAYSGQMLRLRFAEVDNVGFFLMGVDNVTFQTQAVPEPGSLALASLAMLALFGVIGSRRRTAALVCSMAAMIVPLAARADSIPVEVLDPSLQVNTVIATGLTQPIGIVFIGSNDFLVLEKSSGQIKRVIGGVLQGAPVLDLSVNSSSERGLLSIALHPNFPATPQVFVVWTESSSGIDSTTVADTPLLGNRVDRFVWNGSTMVFDGNVLRYRARQSDNIATSGHPGTQNGNENGNHNGGVVRFGLDGKLYLFIGDVGRRGWLQNLSNGPFLTPPFVDDTFGGPAPDNAHLSGVVLRLNSDGTTPLDNPFFAAGAAMGGEVGANVQKIYSYGHRNGFGMAFDPFSGSLWATENADDAYAEINRVIPGMNGGWIQFAGPASRQPDWKSIETLQFNRSLQQVRYPPTRAAYTATLALSRLFMLPGAVYKDPELSWRYEVGPSGAAFVSGAGLGSEYTGSLWVGSARAFSQVGGTGGSLYRLRLTPDRLQVDVSADARLTDKVADNLFRAQKFDGTESETLIIGRGFGTTPAIEEGPDGALYVVSITDNAIYRISRRP